MRRFAAAIAAITLIAGTAHAQGHGGGGGGGGNRGSGNDQTMRGGGGGGGGGNGNAMRGGGGGGGGNADHGNRGNGGGGNAERGNGGGGGQSMASSMRGSDQRGNGGGNGNAMRGGGGGGNTDRGNQGGGNANRGNSDRGNGNARVERVSGDHGRGNDNRVVVDRGRGNDNRTVVIDRGRDSGDVNIVHVRDFDTLGRRGFINGCPPGLAKKNPPCVPPGLARGGDRYDDDFRRVLRIDRPDFWGMRLDNGSYLYDDGYLLRVGREGRIIDYVPLLGGALGVGQVWPSYYEPYRLPNYYEQYYGLGPYQSYRYADNVIYRLDPETAAITSIAALLTGDDFTVGQPMPIGYDVYNVPYGYRDRYVDGPDAYYRYADGYIYQVDPETQLIAAAIQLLAS